ncbi:hypothetical protein LCGC14_0778900 [marine sediment metagenome]|uniref:Uncharacterized protein n=1 Tax=marine sediment metagenome TaxID=412755 RepID=A0A0F9Q0C8_9ZZZZ
MALLDVEFDSRDTQRWLGKMAKQTAFALSVAINDTLKDAQKVQRAHQRRVFTVRRPRYVEQAVKIKPFATKRTLTGTMAIDPPGSKRTADILAKFETGGTKRPRGRHLAVPVEAKRTKAGVVSRRNRPKGFKFKRVGRSIRGERRTFIIPSIGIFQRVGRRKNSQIRLLYRFKTSVPIGRRLDFIANAERVVQQMFDKNFERAFDRAVATAR